MNNKLDNNLVQQLLGKRSSAQEEVSVTLDEIESFGNKESLREMFTDIQKYDLMLKQKITFVNNSLTTVIPFTRENLYLICAYTGSGKSTMAANISFPLWKQQKKILVISNEESKQDVIFRIACLELGYNFNDHKKGIMPQDQKLKVAALYEDITKYVKVIDIGYKGGITTKLEGIKNILDQVKNADYSCAMIDYYQLIQYSVNDKSRNRYDVLNDLRIWLGQYIKTSNIPIVMFAQLHSFGKRSNKDLDSRIKECPSIQEPATVVIEVIPNFDNKTSEFVIHKDRFGAAGSRIMCGFEKGRYVNLTDDHIRKLALQKLDDLLEEDDVLHKTVTQQEVKQDVG